MTQERIQRGDVTRYNLMATKTTTSTIMMMVMMRMKTSKGIPNGTKRHKLSSKCDHPSEKISVMCAFWVTLVGGDASLILYVNPCITYDLTNAHRHSFAQTLTNDEYSMFSRVILMWKYTLDHLIRSTYVLLNSHLRRD